MAQALGRLGSRRAFVVHGNDGLDEITIADSTSVWELKDGTVSEYSISPADFGLNAASLHDIRASHADESAGILRNVLDGGAGAARDIVLLNAAAALLAAGKVLSMQTGVEIAADAIDTGSAKNRMDAFVELSNGLA